MPSKMAAKEERFYCVCFFSYINISEDFISEICLNVCFLYTICNIEFFSTVNSSKASKMATKMENPIH